VLDYEAAFKTAVIDRFAESYVAGRDPCVRGVQTSRSSSRFAGDPARARPKVLATGHYVASRRLADGSLRLISRPQEARDQSYSCSPHARAAPNFGRFPLATGQDRGARLAHGFGLAVATRDSQEWFRAAGPYSEVIER